MRIDHGGQLLGDAPRPRGARTRVEVELLPGESVLIGDRRCTVVEVAPGEVALRFDEALPAAADDAFARRAAVLADLAR